MDTSKLSPPYPHYSSVCLHVQHIFENSLLCLCSDRGHILGLSFSPVSDLVALDIHLSFGRPCIQSLHVSSSFWCFTMHRHVNCSMQVAAWEPAHWIVLTADPTQKQEKRLWLCKCGEIPLIPPAKAWSIWSVSFIRDSDLFQKLSS